MIKLKRAVKGSEGFTLMEIVVVLAVVALLAAALTPMILTYLEDAKKVQAQGDANQIAAAVAAHFKDTGLLAYKNNTTTAKIPKLETDDFRCLVSDKGNDFTTTTDETTSDSWTTTAGVECLTSAAGKRDTIENHLINNSPAGVQAKNYQSSGKNAWKGPYIPRVNADPWGNKYLVNVGKGDPSVAFGSLNAVFVISAGPNGVLETSANQSASATLQPGGDDIIARAK